MKIYDQATNLQARMKAAMDAEASDELISRGNTVREELHNAADYLSEVLLFRTEIGTHGAPAIDAKKLRQAIVRFQKALSQRGPNALQQQCAETVLTTLKSESARVERWVRSVWKTQFDDVEDLLHRENSGELLGSAESGTRAAKLAAGLRSARSADPVRGLGRLEDRLGCQGLKECLQRIQGRGEELRTVIEAIDQGQEELPPQIQKILDQANSEEGLPLSEVTTVVLTALDAAGVLNHLVVRRS